LLVGGVEPITSLTLLSKPTEPTLYFKIVSGGVDFGLL